MASGFWNIGKIPELRNRLLLSVSGDNLLDNQTGEPDNISVLRGRTISVGLQAKF